MKTETTVPVFDPKPTNAQLTALVLSKVDEAPHVLIGYQHLSPERTRVMATVINRPDLDDLALETLLHDIDQREQMEAERAAKAAGI